MVNIPLLFIPLICATVGIIAFTAVYRILHRPRAALESEKYYQTTRKDGSRVSTQSQSWYDTWLRSLREEQQQRPPPKKHAQRAPVPSNIPIEPSSVALTVVIPAYNEASRIYVAMAEMVDFLEPRFGSPTTSGVQQLVPSHQNVSGYEIIVVNDGSTDNTSGVVMRLARDKQLSGRVRVIELELNRGKGGAVMQGMRHARGEYVLFADADGATRFSDLDKLLEACDKTVDSAGRAIAIGSRAHMEKAALVERSWARNFLMKGFHLVTHTLTPAQTSRVRDTQCGFKLLTRAALPYIVPYMRSEGWIFDIELLMLAESAPAPPPSMTAKTVVSELSPHNARTGIKFTEVPVSWSEMPGSKVNLPRDAIKMLWSLLILRARWMIGLRRGGPNE